MYGRALAAAVGGGCAVGSRWIVGSRAEAAKLTQPYQGMVSLGTGFLSGFFLSFFPWNMMKILFPLHIPIYANVIFLYIIQSPKTKMKDALVNKSLHCWQHT